MNKETELPIEEQNIHVRPGQEFGIGLAVSNAASLVKLEPTKVAYLNAKHGQRVEGMAEALVNGILLTTPTQKPNPEVAQLESVGRQLATDQAAYMSELSGNKVKIQVFTQEDLKRELARGKKAVLTPYVNNGPFQESFAQMGLNGYEVAVSGVPSTIVEAINGKKEFHERISSLRDPLFAVPHYDVATVDETIEKAEEMLAFEDELYAAVGLPNYTRGVVLRPNYSDGGYGACMVYEKEGKITVSNDEPARAPFNTWKEALQNAHDYLKRVTGDNGAADIVISRFMIVPETPGLSIFFTGKDDTNNSLEAVSLGFNGQIQHPNSKACIGTTTYKSENNALTEGYESTITAKAKAFISHVMIEKNVPPNEMRGLINFDVMLLDEEEQILQQEITRLLRENPHSLSVSLKDKLTKYKQLEEPASYFLAESNPRSTDYTGAIYAVLNAEGKPHTIQNMKEVIEQGISTGVTIQVPDGVDIKTLRQELLEQFRPERRESGLIILKTAPVEILGQTQDGHGREMSAIFTREQNEQRLIPIFQRAGAKAA